MEEIIINILKFTNTILILMCLLYIIYFSVKKYHKKYITYIPIVILCYLLVLGFSVQTAYNQSILNYMNVLLWSFDTIYWSLLYKKQQTQRVIYNHIFKNE